MSMEQLDQLAKAQEPLLVSPEVFQQLGTITRTLHDTMQRLGVMPKLQVATDGLPDARSRLNYIATKTAAAAEKVLNSVDQAKAEHAGISKATQELAAAIVADPVKAQQALQKSKFPTVVGGGVMRVGSGSACGAMIAFAQDVDLDSLIP